MLCEWRIQKFHIRRFCFNGSLRLILCPDDVFTSIYLLFLVVRLYVNSVKRTALDAHRNSWEGKWKKKKIRSPFKFLSVRCKSFFCSFFFAIVRNAHISIDANEKNNEMILASIYSFRDWLCDGKGTWALSTHTQLAQRRMKQWWKKSATAECIACMVDLHMKSLRNVTNA